MAREGCIHLIVTNASIAVTTGKPNETSRRSTTGVPSSPRFVAPFFDHVVFAGGVRLAVGGNVRRALAEGGEFRRQGHGAVVDLVSLSIDPRHLHLIVHFRALRLVEFIADDHALGIVDDFGRQDAIGVGAADHFVRRFLFDLFANRLGQRLAQIGPEAVRIDHRHVNGADIGRKQRGVADVVAGAAGEKGRRQKAEGSRR